MYSWAKVEHPIPEVVSRMEMCIPKFIGWISTPKVTTGERALRR